MSSIEFIVEPHTFVFAKITILEPVVLSFHFYKNHWQWSGEWWHFLSTLQDLQWGKSLQRGLEDEQYIIQILVAVKNWYCNECVHITVNFNYLKNIVQESSNRLNSFIVISSSMLSQKEQFWLKKNFAYLLQYVENFSSSL